MYSQTHTQLPVGRRREVESATPVIRLQRPFGIIQDFPKKTSKITTLLKISCISREMYDILKHALATQSWQCRGSGQLPLLPNPSIMDFTDAKGDYSKNENKIQHFFTPANFCVNPSRPPTNFGVHEYVRCPFGTQ